MKSHVLERLQAALTKPNVQPNIQLALCVTPLAHTSLVGGVETWYPLVHLNKSAGWAWIVNPATDYVCRVALSEVINFKYLKGVSPAEVGTPTPAADQLYVVFTTGKIDLPTKEEAQALAIAYASKHRGEPVYVGQAVTRVIVPAEPKPEITEY